VLKNTAVVDQLEKVFKDFKAVDYDVSAQLKAIDAFEQKAVSSAEATSAQIESELKQLNTTLSDIEDARPFEDLTLQDLQKARPEIKDTVDTMVTKGKWTVPGYSEKVCRAARVLVPD
jgi:F-type H+-transporting ATPase subunit d